MTSRSTREVLEDHLCSRTNKDLERDLALNYAPDVVMLTGSGVFRGHEGVRESGRLLRERPPEGTFTYRTTLHDGETAFLEWSAEADGARVDDGADSFLIRDGRIVVQTIHYTVRDVDDGSERAEAPWTNHGASVGRG